MLNKEARIKKTEKWGSYYIQLILKKTLTFLSEYFIKK